MDWLKREIVTGIQKLLCLGLEGQPAAEVISGTVAAWHEVIAEGREFDERQDAERFRIAFRTLAATCERWPSPKRFLDALPPRPEPLAISRDRHYDTAVARDNLRRIGEMIGAAVEKTTPPYSREEAA